MECLPVTKLNDAIQRTYEIKLDGYRAIAVKSGPTINLYSRRGKSFNSQYPYLVEALGELPEGTVVDGLMEGSLRWMTLADLTSICYNSLAAEPRAFATSFSTFSFATTATSPDCPWANVVN
jgi:hypothetical protein